MIPPASSAADTATLDDALAGRLGASGVRRVVSDPWQHGLAELLPQCLPGAGDSQKASYPVTLLRSKYKPGRKLTAYYSLRVDGSLRHLALSWEATPPGQGADDVGPSAPSERLAATSGDGRTILLVAPADPRMPQLAGLSRADHLAEVITQLAGSRGEFPSPGTAVVETVRYRPGQRHVLRVGYRTRAGSRTTTYVKLDRDDSGVRAVAVARAVGPVLAAGSPGARLADPLGYSAAHAAALWRQAPGQPLWLRLTPPSTDATALMSLVGRALRVLHEDGPRPGPEVRGDVERLPPRAATDELASTVRAGEHLDVLMPSVAARYRALANRVMDRLDLLPAELPTFTHGDVKCDNIVADGNRICLLDLDRCVQADPALDLAKLLADLRWWCPGDPVGARALTAALVAGYGPCEPGRWARARTLAALFQLKLAARRIPVHDVDWEPLVTARVDDAAAALLAEERP